MATEEHAVAVKLPTFWPSQPDVWFVQVEAQFHLRKITNNDTKYYHVLAALDQDTVTRLIDLITSPPDDDKYTALKTWLTETFGLSERERASRPYTSALSETPSRQYSWTKCSPCVVPTTPVSSLNNFS